jgi:hypothetical protein
VAVIVPYDEYHPRGVQKEGKAGFEIRPGFEIADEDLLAL